MKLPETFHTDGTSVNVIIETPFNSRNKYAYDPSSGFFRLKRVLPEGLSFPCDMGFIPRTLGADGDPLDVLILTEPSTYPGCLITCRLVGILKATQKKNGGSPYRNDRLIAIPLESKEYKHIESISDISSFTLNALIHFFEYYNAMDGQVFTLLQTEGTESAIETVRKQLV